MYYTSIAIIFQPTFACIYPEWPALSTVFETTEKYVRYMFDISQTDISQMYLLQFTAIYCER